MLRRGRRSKTSASAACEFTLLSSAIRRYRIPAASHVASTRKPDRPVQPDSRPLVRRDVEDEPRKAERLAGDEALQKSGTVETSAPKARADPEPVYVEVVTGHEEEQVARFCDPRGNRETIGTRVGDCGERVPLRQRGQPFAAQSDENGRDSAGPTSVITRWAANSDVGRPIARTSAACA